LKVDKAGSGYTLIATCGPSTPAASNAFSVIASGPSTIAAQPAGATSFSGTVGSNLASLPQVIVKDAASNPLAGVSVTFAPAPGSGTIAPVAPVPTAATGIAAMTLWTLP